jgi:hypothetical protein
MPPQSESASSTGVSNAAAQAGAAPTANAGAPRNPAPQSGAAPRNPVTPNYNYRAPRHRPSLVERINVRFIAFVVTFVVIVGYPFYIWMQATLSHGIIRHGNFSEVDLKAMSSFEMDQQIGTINDVPQRWRALDGTKVLLIGQPWAMHDATNGGVHDFQLCYSISQCCFKGPPKVQHFVDCQASDPENGMSIPDTPMIKVYGTLHVSIIKGEGKIQSLYQLTVDRIEDES